VYKKDSLIFVSSYYSFLFTKRIIIEENYTTKISADLVEKFCLAPGEIIPVCFK
jgi:hypothetical protein